MDSEQVDQMLNGLGWMYNTAEVKFIKYNLSKAYCTTDHITYKLIPIFKRKPHANELCKKIWEIIKVTAEEKKTECSHCDNRRKIKILNPKALPFTSEAYKERLFKTLNANDGVHIKCPECSGFGDIKRYLEEINKLCETDRMLVDKYFKFWNPTIDLSKYNEPF